MDINARSDGYDTGTQRIVRENLTQLGFDSHELKPDHRHLRCQRSFPGGERAPSRQDATNHGHR